VTATVNEKLTVTLDIGDIEGNVWNEITLYEITLTDRREQVASIDLLILRYNILSYFAAAFEVSELSIHRPWVSLRQKDETWNLTTWMKETETDPDSEGFPLNISALNIYGGTVDAKNLSAVGMEDDSIDWDEGYRGTLNNIVIYQYDNIGDFAFELASRSGENNATPRALVNVSNVTMRGHNRNDKAAFDLKQGTGGIFDNIVAYNYETIIFLNDQLQEVKNGDLVFTNVDFDYSENLIVNNVDGSDVSATLISSTNPDATGADVSEFEGWTNFDAMGGF
jgi:hypothetical protein